MKHHLSFFGEKEKLTWAPVSRLLTIDANQPHFDQLFFDAIAAPGTPLKMPIMFRDARIGMLFDLLQQTSVHIEKLSACLIVDLSILFPDNLDRFTEHL